MANFRLFWIISSILLIKSTVPGFAAPGVEVAASPAAVQVSVKDVKSTGRGGDISSSSSLTVTTNVEIAVYVISCLAVFLVTLCCFYCCKHFCWEGCRGEASITYQQMAPTPFTTGSVRVIPNNDDTSRLSSPANRNETQVDMIPLQGKWPCQMSTYPFSV